jgi:hypothetical protein
MKIIAKNKKEFNEIIEVCKYLHDFCYPRIIGIEWNPIQWYWNRSFYKVEYCCLDLEKFPILNSLVHLYRIKHAHLEGKNGIEESKALKKIFYIEKN